MTKRLLLPRSQAVGLDGRPLAGAKLYTYATGTATPKAVFTDAALSVPHANPVIADAAGRFPAMFLAVGDYRTILTDAADVTIATDDPVEGQVEPAVDAWADIASAATTILASVNSENLRVTGAATITSFGTAPSGLRRQLRFAAALTLTHNASSLSLPGGANIATAAGDTAEAVSLGGGNWVVMDYTPAVGFLRRDGGTLTGDVTVSKASPRITLTKSASGQSNVIAGGTASFLRWEIVPGDTAAETGVLAAGSNFLINRFSDAGSYADTPLSISRASGVVDFAYRPTHNGTQLAPQPQTAAGVGQLVNIVVTANTTTLPSGGTWAYSVQLFVTGGTRGGQQSGVAAGGATIGGGAATGIDGWAWRIA